MYKLFYKATPTLKENDSVKKVLEEDLKKKDQSKFLKDVKQTLNMTDLSIPSLQPKQTRE